jgi:hypothetical protein
VRGDAGRPGCRLNESDKGCPATPAKKNRRASKGMAAGVARLETANGGPSVMAATVTLGGQSAGQNRQDRPGSDSTAKSSTNRAARPTTSSIAPRPEWARRVLTAAFIATSIGVAVLFSFLLCHVKNFLRTFVNEAGLFRARSGITAFACKDAIRRRAWGAAVQPTLISCKARS